MLGRLDACAVPRQQLHEAEWELLKRAEEIRELQKVLGLPSQTSR